jgi:HAE1 family hydrophobic/amphiphilic exporter-1
MAILVLLFLLLVVTLRRVQLTSIVVASVVFALVICLSLFYFLKLSVNFITISGLTICFGMLLDNSILVLDAIHRRLRGLRQADHEDLSHRTKKRVALETIVAGTGEVMFPIMATTATTIVAFLSFIFLSGRLALYYVPLAIAVGTAMFASVFVAFGWIPVVLNQTWVPRFVRRSRDGNREVEDPRAVEALVEDVPDLEGRPSFPQRVVGWAQSGWWLILPGFVALMIWGGFIYRDDVIKGGFWQMPDEEKLIFFMRMPEGTDIRVTSETMLGFERELMPVRDGAYMRAQVFGNIAYMEIEFEEFLKRTGIPLLYRSLLMQRADNTGGTNIYIAGFSDTPYFKGNPSGSSLNSLVKITGYNSKRLTEIAEHTLAKVERNRRARKARITGTERFGRAGTDETVITLRRDRLADHGLSVLTVVGHIRRLLGVDTPWTMLVEGEQERVQLSFLELTIESPQGTRVRLGDLVTMQTLPLSDAIVRENQRYSMLVNWEYVGTDRMRSALIKKIIDTMDLPYGYAAEEAERTFLTEEEEADLTLTIVLAAVFILMIMTALFESYSLPILVLTSLPMALFGVVVIFWQTTSSFDSSAKIGLVLLFGVVVNNAILLVSRFRTESGLVLKAKLGGDPFAEAALFRGHRRPLGGADLWYLSVGRKERAALLRRAVARGTLIKLRSVLLTSGTTIVGLLPLLLKFEWVPMKLSFLDVTLPFTVSWLDKQNQDIWQNLALTSIGGLLSSTVLILLCLPPLYYFSVRFGWALRRIGQWIAAGWRWLRERLPKPGIRDSNRRLPGGHRRWSSTSPEARYAFSSQRFQSAWQPSPFPVARTRTETEFRTQRTTARWSATAISRTARPGTFRYGRRLPTTCSCPGPYSRQISMVMTISTSWPFRRRTTTTRSGTRIWMVPGASRSSKSSRPTRFLFRGVSSRRISMGTSTLTLSWARPMESAGSRT